MVKKRDFAMAFNLPVYLLAFLGCEQAKLYRSVRSFSDGAQK